MRISLDISLLPKRVFQKIPRPFSERNLRPTTMIRDEKKCTRQKKTHNRCRQFLSKQKHKKIQSWNWNFEMKLNSAHVFPYHL